MPVVHLLTTGGTIARRLDPATGAFAPVVRPEELLAQVPALRDVAEVHVEEFSLISSSNMTPVMMANLARRARSVLADPRVEGLVVTHGTDTMEESAFALDLLLEGSSPVVFTGAMRNMSQPGPDGPRNLLSAVLVAADPRARDLGVLVALNDEVHAARHVTKAHASALNAFVSPGLGPMGILDDEGFWPRWQPARLPHLPPADPEPRVYLVKMAAGMDDLLLRAVLDSGGRGLVVEGTGSGNLYAEWEDALRDLVRAGVPVVLVGRTGSGRINPIYSGPGGGKSMVDLGLIPGGCLTGPKARLALMFALGAGLDREALRAFFAEAGEGG